ncbi:YeeE/YedE family protein [Halococcus agarilyticus]|uniref:YeeE/YedE family protein n=1 Tax=Halococcus agarilyticus TaxID=1232219 RepID=UPI0006776896|nr:YeeE/YedE thiosulfate transporter family protein [Halococcus agarilyticus]
MIEQFDVLTVIGQASLAGLFPRGIGQYAIGGVLIGLGVSIIYLGTAITPGASTFFESTLSYVSTIPRFNRAKYLATRDWRLVFTLSMVAGAAVYALLFGQGGWTTDVQPWRLLGGGVLVGVGTRIGKGCTSGHGINGLASLSRTSFANVATFMAVAIGAALSMQAIGVTP